VSTPLDEANIGCLNEVVEGDVGREPVRGDHAFQADQWKPRRGYGATLAGAGGVAVGEREVQRSERGGAVRVNCRKIVRGDTMAGSDRQELHALVDHIPESELVAVRKILRALMDPLDLALLTAPLDDEPETEEERAEVEQALAEPGAGTPHEELLREFGL